MQDHSSAEIREVILATPVDCEEQPARVKPHLTGKRTPQHDIRLREPRLEIDAVDELLVLRRKIAPCRQNARLAQGVVQPESTPVLVGLEPQRPIGGSPPEGKYGADIG